MAGETHPGRIEQLVSGERLLELLFEPDCRPGVRWLQKATKRRLLPVYVLSERRRLYSPQECREALRRSLRVLPRN